MSANYIQMTPQEPRDVRDLGDSVSAATYDTSSNKSETRYSNLSQDDPKRLLAEHNNMETNPKELKNSLSNSLFGFSVEILGVSTTLLFAVFGILVLKHDGDPAEDGSTAMTLVSISKYGPTIFPIVFAAIVGSAMKSIATFQIQSGSTIGVLEQLLGSRTISGAFFTQIRLRALNFVALGIIFLWCLSPLGSQASLRVIYITPQYLKNTTNLVAMNNFAPYAYSNAGSWATGEISAGAPFTASLIAGRLLQSQNQDLWGNVRLPSIENLHPNGTSWINIRDKQVEYTSLVGVPVGPLAVRGNTSYSLVNSYLKVSCDTFELRPNDDSFPLNFTSNPPPLPSNNSFWQSSMLNPTQFGITIPRKFDPNSTHVDSRQFIFETLNSGGEDITFAQCHLSTAFIEVSISCSSKICEPLAIRPSPNTDIGNRTVFDLTQYPKAILDLLTGLFPRSGISGGQNPLISYILDPSNAITSSNHASVFSIGKETFELRMGQILNTVLMLGIENNPITSSTSAFQSSPLAVPLSTNNAVITIKHDIVRCNRAWLSVLILASLSTCLVVGIAMVLQFYTLAPDVLGSLSLAMLDHEGDGRGRSTWDGDRWTRSRRETVVRLADVRAQQEVGRIGLSVVGTGEGDKDGKLKRGRMYL